MFGTANANAYKQSSMVEIRNARYRCSPHGDGQEGVEYLVDRLLTFNPSRHHFPSLLHSRFNVQDVKNRLTLVRRSIAGTAASINGAI